MPNKNTDDSDGEGLHKARQANVRDISQNRKTPPKPRNLL